MKKHTLIVALLAIPLITACGSTRYPSNAHLIRLCLDAQGNSIQVNDEWDICTRKDGQPVFGRPDNDHGSHNHSHARDNRRFSESDEIRRAGEIEQLIYNNWR